MLYVVGSVALNRAPVPFDFLRIAENGVAGKSCNSGRCGKFQDGVHLRVRLHSATVWEGGEEGTASQPMEGRDVVAHKRKDPIP